MESKRCGWKANFVDEKQTLWVVGCWRKPNCVVGLTIGVIRNCLGGLTIGVESTVEVVLYLNYQTLRTTHTQYSTTFWPFARGSRPSFFQLFNLLLRGPIFSTFGPFDCLAGIFIFIFYTFRPVAKGSQPSFFQPFRPFDKGTPSFFDFCTFRSFVRGYEP